jgi:hypothetical protein
MRAIAAGCFVMSVIAAVVALLGTLGLFETLPPSVVGIGLALLMLGLCGLALWLFNARGIPLGLKSPEEHLRELETAGLLDVADFRATRAFRVEELEDEGLHYYIELVDGRILFLSGQYLYDFEPITGDPELNQPRTFPCSEFSVIRHKTERYVVDIRCRGEVMEPEAVAPPFGKAVRRRGDVPADGEIIGGQSYDKLKQTRLTASAD